MSDIVKFPIRGSDFPPPDDLVKAAQILWEWAAKVQKASPGDVVAHEACFRADDIMRMAERLHIPNGPR